MNRAIRLLCLLPTIALLATPAAAVRLKELSRIEGDREYALVGYGLVVGLAGSGDSDRNRGTRMALANTLSHFQSTVKESEILSRNTAAVIVTATASAFREPGDRVDVQVSSLGDARSLQGGTLVLTPLYDKGETLRALAQGAVTTGSYHYELNSTSIQKNHPTVGVVARGATLESAITPAAMAAEERGNTANLILDRPDMTTAVRTAKAMAMLPAIVEVQVIHAGKIRFSLPENEEEIPALLASIENLDVMPDQPATLVINERTGTLVAGGEIVLGKAVISQDDLRIEINTAFLVSQPYTQFQPGTDISTVTVPQSDISIRDGKDASVVSVDSGATVRDLFDTLRKAKVSTRLMIPIFQSLREAGALNAQIVVQ